MINGADARRVAYVVLHVYGAKGNQLERIELWLDMELTTHPVYGQG